MPAILNVTTNNVVCNSHVGLQPHSDFPKYPTNLFFRIDMIELSPREYEYHEAANLFPLMNDEEFSGLVEDIRVNGLLEPVVLFDDKILDGRNRYRACLELGIEPKYLQYRGTHSPVEYVVSKNLHRRHLNESQRAMLAARIANLPAHRPDKSVNLPTSQIVAADMLNVSEKSVRRAKQVTEQGAPELIKAVESGNVAVSTASVITELPKEEQTELVARGEKEILAAAKSIREAKTLQRRQERIERIIESTHEPTPLTEIGIKYPIIYADPPWQYDFAKDSADEIEEHYPTMPVEDICNLQVSDIATDDCVLFLWATSPKLPEALKVMEAWNFTYKTCAVWDKEWIGPGYYFRQRHELLLVGTKGNVPVPLPEARPDSVYSERRTEHSKKPERYYEFIEAMYPDLPKVELFCRSPRDGWAVWGNECEAK
jgi:N6-adenosine-specific RNA methylase IME4/ParB-like chromosome segregation protein Spo0J